MEFIATFFTHYDAIQFKRKLDNLNIEGKLMPVPRWLSSSCGTCARFSCDDDKLQQLTSFEFELLVKAEDDLHKIVIDNR